jgi:PAS domain S-box-containing protein
MVMDAVLETTPSIAVIADVDGTIVRISRYACELSHRSADEVEGLTMDEYIALNQPCDSRDRPLSKQQLPLCRALKGEHIHGVEGAFLDAHGERIDIVSNSAPFVNAANEVIGAITSVADIRAFKKLERELREAVAVKEMLYRELTHRVKNHLQIMTGLVALEARNPGQSAKSLGEQIKGELQTLAAVYRGMDQAEAGARIEARRFLREICHPYATDEINVELEVTPPDLTLASDVAVPLGMLANEAVCNSHKHAFPAHHGRIQVSMSRPKPGRLRLEVGDDGVGWSAVDLSQTQHGLDLMRLFAKQARAEFELGVHRLGGALVTAEMPEAVD